MVEISCREFLWIFILKKKVFWLFSVILTGKGNEEPKEKESGKKESGKKKKKLNDTKG